LIITSCDQNNVLDDENSMLVH